MDRDLGNNVRDDIHWLHDSGSFIAYFIRAALSFSIPDLYIMSMPSHKVSLSPEGTKTEMLILIKFLNWDAMPWETKDSSRIMRSS